MSRVKQGLSSSIVAIVMVLFMGAVTVGLVHQHNESQPVTKVENSKTTYVQYDGVEGENALDLLKKYAAVETKHYSFGDQVIAINGTRGEGPEYWSFYLNGRLADVGAGAYTAHDSDNIEWKLQAL